ncbi:endonuclease domain-containing protein [Streptomyces rochei]
MKTCRAGGDGWACDRASDRYPMTKGLCKTHYAQTRRGGVLAPINPARATAVGGECGFPDCGNAASAMGLCKGHYQQQRHGQPLSPLRKKRANGTVREMVERGIVECLQCRERKSISQFSPLNASGARRPYCKPCNAERVRLGHYNVTKEFLGRVLLAQGNKCAICGVPGLADTTMHIDHDHACCPGRRSCGTCVRGLLCSRCNFHGLSWYEALPPECRTFRLMNAYLSDPPAKRLRTEKVPTAAA